MLHLKHVTFLMLQVHTVHHLRRSLLIIFYTKEQNKFYSRAEHKLKFYTYSSKGSWTRPFLTPPAEATIPWRKSDSDSCAHTTEITTDLFSFPHFLILVSVMQFKHYKTVCRLYFLCKCSLVVVVMMWWITNCNNSLLLRMQRHKNLFYTIQPEQLLFLRTVTCCHWIKLSVNMVLNSTDFINRFEQQTMSQNRFNPIQQNTPINTNKWCVCWQEFTWTVSTY